MEEPPSTLDASWRLMVKKRAPVVVCHMATIGLRLESHAEFVGSIRPGLKLLCASLMQFISVRISIRTSA